MNLGPGETPNELPIIIDADEDGSCGCKLNSYLLFGTTDLEGGVVCHDITKGVHFQRTGGVQPRGLVSDGMV
jgi:hypothetical protein